ncbi:MAG: undecaprenyl-diphosphatase UppP [Acidobacteria bacterium]|nr:undecaprenyl-diphosphatase UppP [Acidobacteriota bacterium]
MPIYQAVILAIVQGFTEFLPISSSAHLALAPWLFGWADQGLTFDIALHFGTLLAVLIYFFRDIVQLVGAAFHLNTGTDPDLRDNRSLMWKIGLGTIPVGVAGLLLKHAAETTFRNPWVIGAMLVSVGLLMAYAERIALLRKRIAHVSWFDAVTIGLAQALAVIPGTSRSGITITAGLFRGFDRESAARFSFLLSTPAIAAAAADAFYDLFKAGGIPAGEHPVFFIGMAVSAITGCFVIGFFLRFLRARTLSFFIAYRIVFGIIILALAFFRR